jgi:hypothetical protein
MRYNFALALPVVAALFAFGPSSQAATPDSTAVAAQEEAFTAAFGCSKQNAVSVALRRVGGGRVIQVVLETTDFPVHWSIDILGSTNEYEVWVNASCKVIRVITQPL